MDNLAVRVSEETLTNLQLGDEARVIIGESLTSNFGNVQKSYGLIVDDQGLGINTTIERRNQMNGQALYIDGDVYITGKIQASNYYPLHDTAYDHLKLGEGDYVDFDGTLYTGDLKATGLIGGGAGFWLLSDTSNNNVYYPGRATIGNRTTANTNRFALNVNKYADRDIYQAQLGIQNQQNSQLRLGILGNGTENHSPSVINTNSGTRLEFHIGRDQDYFYEMYHRSNYLPYPVNSLSGDQDPILVVDPLDAPDYNSMSDPALAPHMVLDEAGNVGIHTSRNRVITYKQRILDPNRPTNVIFPQVSESAALHVEGTTYTKDLVVFDSETGTSKNIDELYVRQMGITFDASQIKPGTFGAGDYTFLSNVNIHQNLTVGNNTHTNSLNVDDVAYFNHVIAEDTVVFKNASFCNDIYVQSDLIVNESLKVASGIFTPVLTSNGDTTWQAVQFQVAGAGMCNINYLGDGFTTPGKFGTGINPYTDDVFSQFTVIKHHAEDTDFEIEILDKSRSNYIKGAYIGHPPLAPEMEPDGSLVIATPQPTDIQYVFNNDYIKQNIYFFPGADMTNNVIPIVRPDVPPTFAIFSEGQIGVGTYTPQATCDIRGSLMFSDALIYNDGASQVEIGLWKTQRRQNSGEIIGIRYLNESAPRVAINASIDSRYSLNVGGKIRATTAYYTPDNRKSVMWMDGDDSDTTSNFSSPLLGYNLFTWGNVGVGVTQATATMELKNNFGTETSLKLTRGGDSDIPTSSIEFAGNSDSWFIKAQSVDSQNRFEIGRNNATFNSTSGIRPLWMNYDSTQDRHQVFIASDLDTINRINTTGFDADAALTVNGNMNVFGDINATGVYKLNGVLQVYNSNMLSSNIAYNERGLGVDDVFIAGRHIVFSPSETKTVMIGVPPQDDAIDTGVDKNSLLRLYQQSSAASNSVLCSMRTAGTTALISLIAENSRDSTNPVSKQLKFGVFNPSDNNGSAFAFVDEDDRPYITFQTNGTAADSLSERYVGFNTNVPSAMLHVSTLSSGSNMLKLTKVVPGQDSSDAAASLELERLRSDTEFSSKWSIKGPMYASERIGFVYNNNTNTPASEVFTMTSTGRLGIGSTNPEHAIDLKGTGNQASIRIWNEGVQAAPQLIFQSGDREFGADAYTDYMMGASSNNFRLYSENVNGDAQTILHVDDSGKIGIGTDAPPALYDVNIVGTVNVTSKLYVDGNLIFDGAQMDGGGGAASTNFTAAGINVLIRPDPLSGGGVVVNGRLTDNASTNRAFGNLFHVHSGRNANMSVFDSTYNDLQMHYRACQRPGVYNTYRMGVRDQELYWEFRGNEGYTGAVSASHTGYSKVLAWQPSTRVGASSDFDASLAGCLTLASSTASVFMGQSGVLGSSNGVVWLTSSNSIGIGTSNPISSVHVYTSNSCVTLQQGGTGDILQVKRNTGTNALIVDTIGNIGIRRVPRSTLDIADGQVMVPPGTPAAPSYTFGGDTAGIFSPSAGSIAIATSGSERMRVGAAGNVSIGSTVTPALFSVTYNSISAPLVAFTQTGSADTLRVTGSNNVSTLRCKANGTIECGALDVSGSITPTSNSVYDLGTASLRWRDLYLSGNTLDIQGTQLSRTNNGDIQIGGSSDLKNVIVGKVNIGNSLVISTGDNNQVTFTSINSNTGQVLNTYTPLTTNDATSSISIGTSAEDATIHLTTKPTVMYPTMILEQLGPCNLVQMINNTKRVLTVNNQGAVGIGSSAPRGPLDIHASNIASALFVTQSNTVGNIATFGNATAAKIVFDGRGNVGINTVSPQASLHIVGQQMFDGWSTFTSNVNMQANLVVSGNTITHGDAVTDSDSRLKTDLVRIENALEKVHKLTGYTFLRINDNKRSTGLVAQDVLEVLPEAVDRVSSYHYGVAYGNMMGLIVEAIKELTIEVNKLKERT